MSDKWYEDLTSFNATIDVYKIKNGSKFSIGKHRTTTYYIDHHFNWFQKLMWKWCFGIKIEDYSEEESMKIYEAIERIKDHMVVHHMEEGTRCEHITEALSMAISALACIEQIRWERDIAIAQLDELGVSFGEKIDGVYLTKEEYDDLCQYKYMYEDLCK